MPREQQQVAAHRDGADQLTDETKHSNTRQQPRAADIANRGEDDHAECDARRDCRSRRKTQHLRHVGSAAGRDRGDGDEQRAPIYPAGHPRPTLADQPACPGIQAPGDGKLRDDFAEHQADEHLADAHEQIPPEHRRTARREGESEQTVDTHDRRQVREPEREVLELGHRAIELRGVTERLELGGVGCRDTSSGRFGARDGRLA